VQGGGDPIDPLGGPRGPAGRGPPAHGRAQGGRSSATLMAACCAWCGVALEARPAGPTLRRCARRGQRAGELRTSRPSASSASCAGFSPRRTRCTGSGDDERACGRRQRCCPSLEALRGVEQNRFPPTSTCTAHTLEVFDRTVAPDERGRPERARAGPPPSPRSERPWEELLAEPLADELTRGDALRWGRAAARRRPSP